MRIYLYEIINWFHQEKLKMKNRKEELKEIKNIAGKLQRQAEGKKDDN